MTKHLSCFYTKEIYENSFRFGTTCPQTCSTPQSPTSTPSWPKWRWPFKTKIQHQIYNKKLDCFKFQTFLAKMNVTFRNQIYIKKLDCFKFPAMNARRNINLSKCCNLTCMHLMLPNGNLTWNINERNCNKKRCISTDIVRWLIAYAAEVLPTVILRWNSSEKSVKFIGKVCSCKTKKVEISLTLQKTVSPAQCVLCWSNWWLAAYQNNSQNLTWQLQL